MKNYLLFALLTCFVSCKKVKKEENNAQEKNSSEIKYAKGFDIIKDGSLTKLIIKKPYKDSKETFEYIVSYNKQPNSIKVPVEKLVVTSTTHIPMIELLEKEDAIIGFPHTKYISSEKTRKLVDNGSIVEIGKEASLNTEILLDLQPELVVGFAVSNISKVYKTIESAGIPVVMNGGWLEETPLGRAEWIKFFGLILDKEKEADSIFSVIEQNYLNAKQIALKSNKQPTILSGAIMNSEVWNLPAGESFVAQYLKDANLNYLWGKTKGRGSLSLSFESVLDKGQNADVWIAPGYFNTKEQMLQSNTNYQQFSAFKNDKVYTPNLRKGSTGGTIYFELAPVRPDLVLKDIIKITQPELLPDYQTTFFDKMK
ncbi:ABC transporter substrate-binding protein [Tenacibaculum sp. 190130A14a]|uniref:Iron complex transport system substrate-binding protein n=1 Tax=Tenacibaculum polynesiense TaxID=3137857 RepID=A0ABM9PCJ7_9FLAO